MLSKEQWKKIKILCHNATQKNIVAQLIANDTGFTIENDTQEFLDKNHNAWVGIMSYKDEIGTWIGQAPSGKGFDFSELDSAIRYASGVHQVRLNDSYTAIVTKDGIQVGCQKFEWKVIEGPFGEKSYVMA